MEYKKKLTDIFLRKQDKSKKQVIPQKPKILQFDESFFEAQLFSDNISTSLIKVAASIKKGSNQGQQIPLNCKWYIKNQFDFKQIQQVKASCFQPCLQDVGNIICVQIQPFIEGMNYTGITIMKQSEQLKMDKKLESMTNQYFNSRHLQMEGRIQIMYSQNPKYQNYQYPKDILITLRDNKITFKDKITKDLICQQIIKQDFPQIDFIRKSFNSILLHLNQNQSMKLSLSNNFNRDLFALIVRSIPNRLVLSSNLQLNNEKELVLNHKQKNQTDTHTTQQTTKLILKVDELNKEIKGLKRINQQLTTNYHIERNAKNNLLNEIEKIKTSMQKLNQQHKECQPLHLKIKQVSQQNKFYFGELSLLKTEIKQKNTSIKSLNQQMKKFKSQNQLLKSKLHDINQQPLAKIENLQLQLSKIKSNRQQIESQNQSLKQKVNELQNANNLLKKKVSSIVNQKSLPTSPVKSASFISSFQDFNTPSKDPQVKNLKMQITNLQMLLKHKSSNQKGGQALRMNQIVNKLTQKIGQKQLQIQTLKSINKELVKSFSPK